MLELPEEQQHDFIERHRVSVKEHEAEEVAEWDRKHQEEIQAAIGRDGPDHAGHVEEGCLITGFLEVRRVPGSVVVEAFSPWHEFANHKLHMDHTVHHYSFGEMGAAAMIQSGQAGNFVMPQPEKDGSAVHTRMNIADVGHKAHYVSTLSGGKFTSEGSPHHTHEHYLKVVETQVVHKDLKHLEHFTDAHVYRYTSSSHEYKEEGNIPKIKFTYDLDPMGVLVQDNAMPLYKFLTSVCAIIGGAFTMFGLLDGVFYHSMRSLEKKMQLGKAN